VTSNRSGLVQKIVEEALSAPDDRRRVLVRDRCEGDLSLERDVLRVLGSGPGSNPDETTHVVVSPSPVRTGSASKQFSFALGSLVANRFEVLRFLSRGGMGEVYEGWDLDLKERVALKTVRPEIAFSADVLERFKREVKQARAISHANVCRVHELFSDESTYTRVWFLSMEFLEGVTLSDHIKHHGPMKPPEAYELVEQLVNGLMAAHRLGVIHRDFKTSNVMLVNSGPGRVRAVITDFGLALNVFGPREGLLEPGGQGTPDFMAPEQYETGEVTFLADQYALGVVMCELLTGARPTRPARNSGVRAKLPAIPIDRRWRKVILRCLEPLPENRFQKMDDILAALAPRPLVSKKVLWALTAVLLAALGIGGWYLLRPASPPLSLAVLPLQNHTGDPAMDYLGAGISEALTYDLSQMPGLQVAAETVARRYHGDNVDLQGAGRDLRVSSIVDGAISAHDQVLTVPIELIDVKTGREVWGQTYSGNLSQVAELQHQISTDVAYRLKIRLDPDIKDRLKRQYSTNSTTYNAYLEGRYHLAQRAPEALEKAIDDFQRAIDHDPEYAPAYSGLADCYTLLASYGQQEPIPLFTKAMAATQHALELDSTLGEAYTSRALARTFLNFDWQGAEADYKRAIELNPTYLTAHTWYAMTLLMPLGRPAEAAAQLGYTQTADPKSLVTIMSLATMNYLSGDFEKSLSLVDALGKAAQGFEPALDVMAYDYLALNLNDKVISLLDTGQLPKEIQILRAAPLGIAYARRGEKAKAEAEVKMLAESVRNGNFISYDTARLYTALGDREHALDMLELAYARREANIVFLNVDPGLAPLRSEPRFLKLLRLMNVR
jgi:TolB-like protein/tRNA A-37 threonylcarbamoyl transferase component Bud32/Tfp pilus assembly protein PilF